MSSLVLREDRDSVCVLTLNRPESLNALNMAVFVELNEHVNDLIAHPNDFGCVLLRGAGKSFCAGADLKNRETGDAIVAARVFKGNVVKKLATLPQPVVAAVKGNCLTGGLEMALTADIIIASESAVFADTHGKWGLVASWGLTQRLPRRVGKTRAKEMMLTGRRYTGRQAEAMGLANFCVPDSEFEAEVKKLVDSVVANSWHTNRSYKRILDDTDGLSLAAGLAWELQNHPGSAPDVLDRIQRFSRKA